MADREITPNFQEVSAMEWLNFGKKEMFAYPTEGACIIVDKFGREWSCSMNVPSEMICQKDLECWMPHADDNLFTITFGKNRQKVAVFFMGKKIKLMAMGFKTKEDAQSFSEKLYASKCKGVH